MSLRNILITFSLGLLFSGPLWAQNGGFLGVGDIVKITVYGQPDMTTVTRISERNSINFPLIGDVAIGGKSADEAETVIARELSRRGFVKNAQVNLFVEQSFQALNDTVTILGEVARPGNYPIQGSAVEGVQSVVDLVAAAGGTTENAGAVVSLVRGGTGGRTKLDIDLYEILTSGTTNPASYKLAGGDVIFVPEMDVFYIYGQVQRPGRYRLERGMRVMQALSVSGGISDRGSEKGVEIKRNVDGAIKDIDVDATDEVLKGDVIYVKERLF
ncbi:polysaccharide biosynthesis/export family protein [Halioxenophilus aromaticivorans]